jgi:hypothetical protein
LKYTLLDMTQTILSSMDGDEVNSIDDTIEAQQVARVIRTAYFDIVSAADLPEHFGMINLVATSTDTPTVLTRPTTIDFIDVFNYNAIADGETEDNWQEVEYLDSHEFLKMVRKFDQTADNVGTFELTDSGFTTKYYYENDRAPKYWTSLGDEYIICDAYDSAVDSYLQSSKTSCYGKLIKTFSLEDDFTPDLDDQQFSLLLNEAKALAWAEIKQAAHQKAEKNARYAKIKLERNKKDLPGKDGWYNSLPNYGRHR